MLACTHLFDLCEFLVILQEEGEVLVGDIHLRVTTKLLVFLLCVSPTRERILGDLLNGQQIIIPRLGRVGDLPCA